MPAHATLTRKRERRALALIGGGASVAEASRAIEVSRSTFYRRVRSDPLFAELLRAAREQRAPDPVPVEPPDWREIARQLEREHPEHWALPDPFDFDPLA
jgi:transposase